MKQTKVWPTRPLADRFWEKVDKGAPDECWLWNAGRSTFGYGTFGMGSKTDGTNRAHPAHRVAYELTHGPIPPGKVVCHKCDVRLCCNPAHLFVGSQADNLADMHSKNRHVRGNMNSKAKLTPDKVAKIRELRETGMPYRKIATHFDVSEKAIRKIIKGEMWHHVPLS